MIEPGIPPDDSVDTRVRRFIFETAAETGSVPQKAEIAHALGMSADGAYEAITRLGMARVLMLAPNGGDIWAANPFCAVPSGFRVETDAQRYWGICAWDALGIVAAVHARSASVRAPCGDCGDMLHLRFDNGELARAEGVIHFAVPAREWWRNVGFS